MRVNVSKSYHVIVYALICSVEKLHSVFMNQHKLISLNLTFASTVLIALALEFEESPGKNQMEIIDRCRFVRFWWFLKIVCDCGKVKLIFVFSYHFSYISEYVCRNPLNVTYS